MKTIGMMIIGIFLGALWACGPEADTSLNVEHPGTPSKTFTSTGPRFTVSRVGVFEDGLAYNGERGIYVITDSKTGEEYVGISGVGVASTGSHTSGKTIVEDER
jgi:hypothetical protein